MKAWDRGVDEYVICGEAMPLFSTTCDLPAGHSPTDVHRSGGTEWTSADTVQQSVTFSAYADKVMQYGVYPRNQAIVYPALGLTGEAGETADHIKKMIRDDGGRMTQERREKVLLELGDVLWYVAALARDLDSSLDEVADLNMRKLAARNAKGKIHGEGSDR